VGLAEVCQQNEGVAILSPLRSKGGTGVLQAPGPNPVTPLRVAQVHQEGRLMTCKEIGGAASLTAPQTKRELDSGRASPTPGPLPASAIQFHLFAD
jgi:hypothetical protein